MVNVLAAGLTGDVQRGVERGNLPSCTNGEEVLC